MLRDFFLCCGVSPEAVNGERGNKAHGVFGWKLDTETTGSVREEPEVEDHLCMEKARGSLRIYSTVVLGPRVGYPLRRGTNKD